MTDAGHGELQLALVDPEGNEVPYQIEENARGEFRVTYTPVANGEHRVYIKFGGDNIPSSPYVVAIQLR